MEAKITIRGEDLSSDMLKKISGELEKLGVSVKNTEPPAQKMNDWLGRTNSVLGVFGAALSVGAAIGFAKALLDDVDALVQLHDKTGLSFQGLQRFKIAGDDAGNTVEQMSAGLNKLQDNLVGGNKSTVAALGRLHVDLDDFRKLSPENQFIAISDAIRTIRDPAEQVNVAIDLFGKTGAELLPVLKRGFDDVKDAAVGMSDETIANLDALGDAWAKFATGFKGTAANVLVEAWQIVTDSWKYGGHQGQEILREVEAEHQRLVEMINKVPPAAKDMGKQLQVTAFDAKSVDTAVAELNKSIAEHQAKVKKARDEQAAWNENTKDVESNLGSWRKTLLSLDGTIVESIRYLLDLGIGQDKIAKYYGVTKQQVAAVDAAQKENIATMRAVASAVESTEVPFNTFIEQQSKIGGGLTNIEILAKQFRAEWGLVRDESIANTKQQHEWNDALSDTSDEVADLSESFATLAQVSGDSWGGVAKDIGLAFSAADLFIKSFEKFDSDKLVGQLADVAAAYAAFAQSAQQGGALSGATTGAAIGYKFGGPYGAAFGAAAGAAYGSNKGKQKKHEAFDSAIQSRDDFLAGFADDSQLFSSYQEQVQNGLARLREQAKAAGVDLSGMWVNGSSTTEGLLYSMQNIRKQLDLKDIADQFKKLKDDTLAGFADPMLKYATQQERVQAGLEALTDRAGTAGVSLEAMWATGSPEAFQAALQTVTDEIDFQDQSMATLNETAQKYGLTTEELGSKWAAQELDKKAQELYQDWTLLTGAGADVNAVAEKMGPAMTDFVNESIKAGQEIPASMKPIVDAMIAQGSLLDENGNKITDAEGAGISYSETMTQGFSKVTKSVDRMVEAISKMLGLTIETGEETEDSQGKAAAAIDKTTKALQAAEAQAQQTAGTTTQGAESISTAFDQGVSDSIDEAWLTMQRTFGDGVPDLIATSIDRVGDLADAILGLPDGDIAINMTRTGDGAAFTGFTSYANEGYDIGSPRLAMIGDARADTESILHARTVRSIVQAAGAAGGARDVAAIRDTILADNRATREMLRSAMRSLPVSMRHALRGTW